MTSKLHNYYVLLNCVSAENRLILARLIHVSAGQVEVEGFKWDLVGGAFDSWQVTMPTLGTNPCVPMGSARSSLPSKSLSTLQVRPAP